ncbi:hypothetical protein ACF0H5_001389 [Mactra antiquata]
MALEQIKATLAGTWNIDRDENLDEYLDAIKIGSVKKQVVKKLKPTLTISVDGDTIEVKIAGGPADVMTVKNRFKLEETFIADAAGVTGEGLTKFVDGRLETDVTPKDKDKPKQKIIREVVNGELVQTMLVGDVTSKRIFKKK